MNVAGKMAFGAGQGYPHIFPPLELSAPCRDIIRNKEVDLGGPADGNCDVENVSRPGAFGSLMRWREGGVKPGQEKVSARRYCHGTGLRGGGDHPARAVLRPL